jgi:hypothetical protein
VGWHLLRPAATNGCGCFIDAILLPDSSLFCEASMVLCAAAAAECVLYKREFVRLQNLSCRTKSSALTQTEVMAVGWHLEVSSSH